jgi:peptidoglycan hydrolase-like protein with peptidoglycan-binding domain
MSRELAMKTPTDKTSTSQPNGDTQIRKPVLQRGSYGSDVVELQKLLLHWEIYFDALDGLFDKPVEVAVKAFQHRVFLKEDGIVGPLTWQALYTGMPVNMPILHPASSGEAVILLQTVLQKFGYFKETINGKFGARTEAAVRVFQKRYGLVPDGIVGPYTWLALSKVPH